MTEYKPKILFLGPCKAGKTKIANFLSDFNYSLDDDLRPTKALRITEFDLSNVNINGTESNIDIQIWDTSGDDKYTSFWPVFRNNSDGVVFVYSQDDEMGIRKLEYMFNYFVTQRNLSLRACLVCSIYNEDFDPSFKPGHDFSKISQLVVNLDSQGEKCKQDFTKYVVSVINCMNEK